MKIIVTGGAGFAGTHFIDFLLKKYENYQIICVDKLTYAGSLENLENAFSNKSFKFEQINISDEIKINRLIKKEKPDLVINFAAESHVDNSIINPLPFIETNIKGTFVLLEACRKYNVSHFHQISTDEVYGDVSLSDMDSLFNEESKLNPSSPYSSAKASADLLVKSYYKTYGMYVTISRSVNLYGPRQFPEKLIPVMITKAIKKEKLPVYGNGLNIRDWLYIDDYCRAIDLIIHNGKSGEIYNISACNKKSNIEVVKKICKLLEYDTNNIIYVEDRKGHDLKYSIDSSKLKEELGWKPLINFDKGLDETIKWYLKRY